MQDKPNGHTWKIITIPSLLIFIIILAKVVRSDDSSAIIFLFLFLGAILFVLYLIWSMFPKHWRVSLDYKSQHFNKFISKYFMRFVGIIIGICFIATLIFYLFEKI